MSDRRLLAYCEPVTATPTSKWHLRRVGGEGLKLGGGVPVPAICGRDLRRGWDLPMAVTEESLRQYGDSVCAACRVHVPPYTAPPVPVGSPGKEGK